MNFIFFVSVACQILAELIGFWNVAALVVPVYKPTFFYPTTPPVENSPDKSVFGGLFGSKKPKNTGNRENQDDVIKIPSTGCSKGEISHPTKNPKPTKRKLPCCFSCLCQLPSSSESNEDRPRDDDQKKEPTGKNWPKVVLVSQV